MILMTAGLGWDTIARLRRRFYRKCFLGSEFHATTTVPNHFPVSQGESRPPFVADLKGRTNGSADGCPRDADVQRIQISPVGKTTSSSRAAADAHLRE